MMNKLNFLAVWSVLFLYGCSDGSASDNYEVAAFIPEGAVVYPYEELPGRSRVIIYQGDKIVGEGDYLNGRAEGAWTEYDAKTGVVIKVTSFLAGKKHGVSLTYEERNGQLKVKEYYNQDQLHGQSLTYNSRKIEEEKNYEYGQLVGMVRKFYPNGKVLEEAPYVNGQIHGTAKWFDEEGNLKIQYQYENGKFIADTTPSGLETETDSGK